MLSVRRPKIPGVLDLAWPVLAWFTNRVFAEDCEIVEMEQAAHDAQGARLESGSVSTDPRVAEAVARMRGAACCTPRDDSPLIPGLQFAKPFPRLAVEAHELHLVDRHVVGR